MPPPNLPPKFKLLSARSLVYSNMVVVFSALSLLVIYLLQNTPAASATDLLVLPLYPFLLISAAILAADTVVLTWFVAKSVLRRDFSHPGRLVLAVVAVVMLVGAGSYYFFAPQPPAKPNEPLLSQADAVKLINACQVTDFSRDTQHLNQEAGTDEIELNYRDQANAANYMPGSYTEFTSLDNWDAMVAAATALGSNCGWTISHSR